MSKLTVEVREYDGADTGAIAPLPQQRLWNDPSLLVARGPTLTITAHRGSHLAGFWLVPLDTGSGERAARRPSRLFPYCAPWLSPGDNLHRRHVFVALVSALQERVVKIDLPLAPGFREANAAVSQGCFAEWRHTHLMARSRWTTNGASNFSAKAIAHAKRAQRHCDVEILQDFAEFQFDRAIHGPSGDVSQRRTLAKTLWTTGRALMLVARQSSSDQVGGAFIAFDASMAYLFHLWSDRSRSGVSALLVREGINTAFQNTSVECFDLEGSVLAGVDEFMSTFRAEIEPYAHLYWTHDGDAVSTLLRDSIGIPGRVIHRGKRPR
jgi:hypothetical protein